MNNSHMHLAAFTAPWAPAPAPAPWHLSALFALSSSAGMLLMLTGGPAMSRGRGRAVMPGRGGRCRRSDPLLQGQRVSLSGAGLEAGQWSAVGHTDRRAGPRDGRTRRRITAAVTTPAAAGAREEAI